MEVGNFEKDYHLPLVMEDTNCSSFFPLRDTRNVASCDSSPCVARVSLTYHYPTGVAPWPAMALLAQTLGHRNPHTDRPLTARLHGQPPVGSRLGYHQVQPLLLPS